MRNLAEWDVFKWGRAGEKKRPSTHIYGVDWKYMTCSPRKHLTVPVALREVGSILYSRILCNSKRIRPGGEIGAKNREPPNFSAWRPLQLIAADRSPRANRVINLIVVSPPRRWECDHPREVSEAGWYTCEPFLKYNPCTGLVIVWSFIQVRQSFLAISPDMKSTIVRVCCLKTI